MNLAETVSALTAVGTLVSMIGGGFYLRGKLDAHAQASVRRLEEIVRKVEMLDGANANEAEERGARKVRNAAFDALATDVKKLEKTSAETVTRLSGHEIECNRRQDAIWERFDKVDRGMENISRQIIAIATGQGGRLYEVKTAGSGET